MCKNDDNLENILSAVKRYSDDIGTQYSLEKSTKVIFKKDSQGESKNIPQDINPEITELEHNKTNKYSRINKVNGIDDAINKGKCEKNPLEGNEVY